MPGIPKLNLNNVPSGGGWAVGEQYAQMPPMQNQLQSKRTVFTVADTSHVEDGAGHTSDDESARPLTADAQKPPQQEQAQQAPAHSDPAVHATDDAAVPDVEPIASAPDAADDASSAGTFVDYGADAAPANTNPTAAAVASLPGAGRSPPQARPPPRPVAVPDRNAAPDAGSADDNVSARRKWRSGEMVSTLELPLPCRAIAIVNGRVWTVSGDGPLTCYALDGSDLTRQHTIDAVTNIRSICLVPEPPKPAAGSSAVAKGSGGDMLWCGREDGQIIIVSLFFAREDYTIPAAHGGCVTQLAAVPHVGRVWSAGKDKSLRLWDVATRRSIARVSLDSGSVILCFAEQTNRLLVACRTSRVVRLYDAKDGRKEQRLSVKVAPALASKTTAMISANDLESFRVAPEVLAMAYHAASSSVWVSFTERLVIASLRPAGEQQGLRSSSSLGGAQLTVHQELPFYAPNVAFLGDRTAIVIGRGDFVPGGQGNYDYINVFRIGTDPAQPPQLIHRGSLIDGVSAVGCHWLGGSSPFAVVAHTTHRSTRCLSVIATREMDPIGSWGIRGHDAAVAAVSDQNQQRLQQQNQQGSGNFGVRRDDSHPATSGHTTPRGSQFVASAPGAASNNRAGGGGNNSGGKLSKQNSSNAPPTGERTLSSASGNNARVSTEAPQQQPAQRSVSPANGAPSASSPTTKQSQPPPSTSATQAGASTSDGTLGATSSSALPPRNPSSASPPRGPPIVGSLPPPQHQSTTAYAESANSSQVAISASTNMATPTVNGSAVPPHSAGGAAPISIRGVRAVPGAPGGGNSATDSTPYDGVTARASADVARVERKVEESLRQLRRMRISQERIGDLSTLLDDSLRCSRRVDLPAAHSSSPLAPVPNDSMEGGSGPAVGLPAIPYEAAEDINERYATGDGRTIATIVRALEAEVLRGREREREAAEANQKLQAQVKQLQGRLAMVAQHPRRGHHQTLSGTLASVPNSGASPVVPLIDSRAGHDPMTLSSTAHPMTPHAATGASSMQGGEEGAVVGSGSGTFGMSDAAAFFHAMEAQRRADRALFDEQLRALQRQHEIAMRKLDALVMGWTRVLSQLELATAVEPPPLIASAAYNAGLPPSAVVADMFAPDSSVVLRPSSSVEEVGIAVHGVCQLLRSHILRDGIPESDHSSNALVDYLDSQSSFVHRRGPSNMSASHNGNGATQSGAGGNTSNARNRRSVRRTASSVFSSKSPLPPTAPNADASVEGSHAGVTPTNGDQRLAAATSIEDAGLQWPVAARLMFHHLDEVERFSSSLTEKVPVLRKAPLAGGPSPLDASGLVLLRAELFAALCHNEAVVNLADVTSDDWPRPTADDETELKSRFSSKLHTTMATIEAAATRTRMELSATTSAGLGLNVAASPRRAEHGQGSVSNALFELQRILAQTTFPVGERALKGFIKWAAVWAVCFAHMLAHVQRSVDVAAECAAEDERQRALKEAKAALLRLQGLRRLERACGFFRVLFEPVDPADADGTGADGSDVDVGPGEPPVLELELSTDDAARQEGVQRGHGRNPFAAWLRRSDERELRMEMGEADSDAERALEALQHTLQKLRQLAVRLMRAAEAAAVPDASADRDGTPVPDTSGRDFGAVSTATRAGAEAGRDTPAAASPEALEQLRREIAGLQTLAKQFNLQQNAATGSIAASPINMSLTGSPAAAELAPRLLVNGNGGNAEAPGRTVLEDEELPAASRTAASIDDA